ncbi:MAG: histidine kinase [Bacteroidales bacterium]|nr:histidine kinase [Bacteroidales bacterium]
MRAVNLIILLVFLFPSIDGHAQAHLADSLPAPWKVQQDVFARFSDFEFLKERDLGAISDIVQDRIGFIWFAGEKGLGRFDGYEFRVYRADSSVGSLHGNLISSLMLDEKGKLWIGHSGGISKYDELQDRFTKIYGFFCDDNAIIDSLYVRALYLEGDSLVWFETLDGWLSQYKRKSNKIERLQVHQIVSQPYYRYHALIKDMDDDLFIGGRGIPPMHYDEQLNRFDQLKIDPDEAPGTKREADVSFLFADKPGFLWVGGLEGLYLYDKDRQYFHKYWAGTVYDMIKSRDGTYWLGSSDGVFRINMQSGETTHYSLNNNDPESLSGVRIFAVFEDRSGRIWLAHENGVSTHQPVKSGIRYLFHIPGLDDTPASSRITSLERKSDHELWIGTADEGLDVLDINTFRVTHYNPDDRTDILSPQIRTLKKHPDGTLYVGYWSGRGFSRLPFGSARFENFSYDPSSFKCDWYNDFEFDQQGNVYLGFWGGPGLTVFEHNNAKFGRELTGQLPDPYTDRLITSLFKAQDRKLWITTTQSGLICYNTEKDSFRSYFEKMRKGGGISDELLYDVVQDSDGNIWASGSNLFLYDAREDKFIKQDLGIEYDFLELYRIHPTKEGTLWLLTSAGLMRYDPAAKWLTDFSVHVKLNFKFSQAAVFQWDENMLILGGSNGLALVETEKLGYRHAFPKVFLTHLDVFNEIYIPLLENLDEVTLAYNQNFFSIHFGTDHWEKEQPYTYFYQLEGFDNEWRALTPQQKSAYFTNVPAGNYVFKMRTGDAYGNGSDHEARLLINVIPAWWQRWWFILLIIFLIGGFVGLIWFLRMRDVKMKWQNTDLNQQLLRLQMNPHFIFNSLTSIQNYIYSNQTHLAGQYLSDFARLIRLILENSRHECVSLEKEIETISLYMKLQKLRFTEKIGFSIKVDPAIDTEITYVPPMMAQPFLENALEHGIKNNIREGVIEVSYVLVDNKIRFELRDNGIGIVTSKSLKTDDQADQHESLSIAICRERIQLLEKKTKTRIPFNVDEIIEDGLVKGTRVAFEIPLKSNFVSRNIKA